jgi:hypothetical protein
VDIVNYATPCVHGFSLPASSAKVGKVMGDFHLFLEIEISNFSVG